MKNNLVMKFIQDNTVLCEGAAVSKKELWRVCHMQNPCKISRKDFFSLVEEAVFCVHGKAFRHDIRVGTSVIRGFAGIRIKTSEDNVLRELTEDAFQRSDCPREADILMTLPDHHVLALDRGAKPLAVLDLKCSVGCATRKIDKFVLLARMERYRKELEEDVKERVDQIWLLKTAEDVINKQN